MIIATVTVWQQVGVETFVDHHISKRFSGDATISEILSWATKVRGEKTSIGHIMFSEEQQ